MKLKLLLFILLLPFVSFGASTNKIDNLWVPSSARFSFGLPGVGKVLTSDAVGFSSWSLPGGGGDVFTTSNNTFIASTTNTFNGQLIARNGVLTNQFGVISIRADPGSTHYVFFKDSANTTRAIITPTAEGITISGLGFFGNSSITLDGTAGILLNSANGISFQTSASFTGGADLNLGAGSDLSVNGNTILGSTAANTITINGTAIATPNGLNFGSGNWVLPAASSGTATNGFANTYFTGGIIATNAASITQIDELVFPGSGIISNRVTGATLQIR